MLFREERIRAPSLMTWAPSSGGEEKYGRFLANLLWKSGKILMVSGWKGLAQSLYLILSPFLLVPQHTRECVSSGTDRMVIAFLSLGSVSIFINDSE